MPTEIVPQQPITTTLTVGQGPAGAAGAPGPQGPIGPPGVGEWNAIANKPSTFPPSNHTHPISEIDSLVASLAAKANSVHSHSAADVTSGTFDPARIPNIDWSTIANKPSTFPPSTHTHPMSEIDTLVATLAGKAASVHTHTAADVTSGTFDPARIPSIDWSTIANKPSIFPPSSHTHPIAEIDTLVATLAGKAASVHTHSAADVTSGTFDAARIPAIDWSTIANKPSTFAPSSHGHPVADVTGAVATVDSNGSLAINRVGQTATVSLNLANSNTWTAKQTFGVASVDGLQLKTLRVLTSPATLGDQTVISVNQESNGSCNGTGSCVELDESTCVSTAGCSWDTADCGDFTSQETCPTYAGCSWTENYCEDIGDESSCTSISTCTWEPEQTGDCSDFSGDEGTCTGFSECSWSDPDCSGTYTIAPAACTGGIYFEACEGGSIELCTGTQDCTDFSSRLPCAAVSGCSWDADPFVLNLSSASTNPNKIHWIFNESTFEPVVLDATASGGFNGPSGVAQTASLPPNSMAQISSFGANRWRETGQPVLGFNY